MKTPKRFPTKLFLAFLKKNKAREFQYRNIKECACASFAKEVLGFDDSFAGGSYVYLWRTGEFSSDMVNLPHYVTRGLRSAGEFFTGAQALKFIAKAKKT